MWRFIHRCPGQQDDSPREYVMLKGERGGQKLTRVMCGLCREEFYILGWGTFDASKAPQPGDPNREGLIIPGRTM